MHAENPAKSIHPEAEKLGAKITELCSYIYAGERMDWDVAVGSLFG